jgi:hypothetical protein
MNDSGAAFIIAHAEAEIYEAAVDLELEIAQASTVTEALRLLHVLQASVERLQTLEFRALERADQLCK